MLFIQKKNLFFFFFSTIIILSTTLSNGAAFSDAESAGEKNSSLLILLDDSESSIGAASGDLIAGLIQNASPIIASASLINNITKFAVPKEKNPIVIHQLINDIAIKPLYLRSKEEEELIKDLLLYVSELKNHLEKNWIIKEINPFLYLLLPKNYLIQHGINLEEAEKFVEQKELITAPEQILGIKINHLKTVSLQSIQKPEPIPFNYFVPFLDNIILTQKEFTNMNATAPKLVIYIIGHGTINYAICNLSIDDFKQFLEFLEKVNISVLIYTSCYAAGTNRELIYKNAVTNIDKTYNFTIIGTALNDSPTFGNLIYPILNGDNIEIKSTYDLNCFFTKLNNQTTTNLTEAIQCLFPNAPLNNIAQIRYPGLPWFSILDTKKVASIGKTMAQTRSEPLNISTYFAKEGKPAQPVGILLYAQNIPFDLIIDIKHQDSGTCYVPTIASMILGDANHHLKKITSTCNTIPDILNSFFIPGLMRRKGFLIDEITAPFSQSLSYALTNGTQTHGTITQVIVDITPGIAQKIYFTHNGQEYYAENYLNETNLPTLATEAQKQEYSSLSANILSKNLISKEFNTKKSDTENLLISLINERTQTIFEIETDHDEAKNNIIDTLEIMENNTAIHVSTIWGNQCPPDNPICWYNLLFELTKFRPKNTHKIIWFDYLALITPSEHAYYTLKNIIIELTPNETNVYYTELDPAHASFNKITGKTNAIDSPPYYTKLIEDYTPAFATIFSTSDASKASNLETESIHTQLTPEKITHIKTSLEKTLKTANN